MELKLEEEEGSLGPKSWAVKEEDEDDPTFPLPSITNFCFLILITFWTKRKEVCGEVDKELSRRDSLSTTRSVGIYRDDAC